MNSGCCVSPCSWAGLAAPGRRGEPRGRGSARDGPPAARAQLRQGSPAATGPPSAWASDGLLRRREAEKGSRPARLAKELLLSSVSRSFTRFLKPGGLKTWRTDTEPTPRPWRHRERGCTEASARVGHGQRHPHTGLRALGCGAFRGVLPRASPRRAGGGLT